MSNSLNARLTHHSDVDPMIDEDPSIRIRGHSSSSSHHHSNRAANIVKNLVILTIILLILASVVAMIIFLIKVRRPHDNNNSAFYRAKLVTGEKGAVAADIPQCSTIGLDILQKEGGNAVDAAIATCLCIGVIGGVSSGIGGGGIMLISLPPSSSLPQGAVKTIDFREMAPLGAHKDMFVDKPTNVSQFGGLSIAVPGEIKGLYTASVKYGKLPWKKVVEPAIRLARDDGFKVTRLIGTQLPNYASYILNDVYGPGLREVYAPNGKLVKEGDTIKNVKLAETLQKIADGGADAFYDVDHPSGLAQDILSDIAKVGGLINATDLSNYHVKESEPLYTYYHGYKVYGAQPEISGGACIVLILNLLERYGLKDYTLDSFQLQHLIVEAMKFAYGHRMELGDPDFTQHLNSSRVLEAMLSKDYAAYLRQYIDTTRTNPNHLNYSPRLDEGIIPLKASVGNHGTAHLSVVDSNRMSVALTTTVNLYFGSLVRGEKTGIIFNDEMDDFSVPGRPNFFNLPPSEANFVAPGKRPLSSMAPTIVTRDGKLKMSVGASGGPLITTSTLQTIVRVLDLGMMVHEAIQAPRVHHQLIPPVLKYERGWNKNTIAKLKEAGHDVVQSDNLGNCQAIVVAQDGKVLQAASDPRKNALAAAY